MIPQNTKKLPIASYWMCVAVASLQEKLVSFVVGHLLLMGVG